MTKTVPTNSTEEGYARVLARVDKALKELYEIRGHPDLSELLSFSDTAPMPPDVLAQLLMNVLPLDKSTMPGNVKAFWAEVGEYMGPDWIASFRKVGAFMHRMDQF